jgi:ABC-type transport system involved in cytochrome c biogenesis permease subunit
MKMFQKDNCRILILTCLALVLQTPEIFSKTGDKFSVDEFGKIMVLESGRKKPMDTYARNKLMQFSGKQTIKGESANKWMARLLLDPQSTDQDLIFLINNPEIADALGIKPRPKRRYSFSELQNSSDVLNSQIETIMGKEENNWTTFDKDIIRTWRNLKEFNSLRSLFSFTEPKELFTITDSTLSKVLGIAEKRPVSYLQLLYRSSKISGQMKEIQMRGTDSLTDFDQAVLTLTKTMYDMEKMVGNPEPHLIPEFDNDGEQWYSLWGLVNRYHTDAMPHVLMGLMISLKQSYMGKNQVEFNETVKQYRNFVITTLATNNQKITDPGLEIVYNKLNSFFFSKILYGIAALFSLLSLSLLWKRSYYVGISLILVGLIFHTAGLLMRLFIMGHPPVSNLYETFVLTAWILAIIGIILEIIRMRSLGILISSVTGFIFLHVASRYSRDGDTMGMLIAVLDSSFWLTTHIVAISLGYAGFVASGLIAHLYLVARVFSKDNESRLQQISRAVYGLFVFGFIFTVAGTMLGGLWADQAWGRFWGWDPKENGALLIILWGLIVLHSRIAGWIKQNGFAIGAVLSVVTVMCTWIGVNLLGIGLHSYGKTSGGAGVFFSYLGIETAFLIVIGILLNIKKTVPNVVQAKVR